MSFLSLGEHSPVITPCIVCQPVRASILIDLSLCTARSHSAKLTVDLQSGAGEMYDLKADPHELVNIFNHPDHARLQAQLSAILHSRPDDIRPNSTQ